MKIYTITETSYFNVDGEWCGDELEALSGTAKSFADRKCAIGELHSWIRETVHNFYEEDNANANETYELVLKQDTFRDAPCNIAHKRDLHEWELQLCGRIYKWSLFEQEI